MQKYDNKFIPELPPKQSDLISEQIGPLECQISVAIMIRVTPDHNTISSFQAILVNEPIDTISKQRYVVTVLP